MYGYIELTVYYILTSAEPFDITIQCRNSGDHARRITMDVQESPPDHAGKHHYLYTIDGKRFEITDDVQDARKLLQKAGLTPADDYVLIELLRPGTRTIGLDEDVDLTGGKEREFRSFLTDRVFNFTVDEIGYEWGSAAISESQLRDIADVPAGKALSLDRRDQEDLFLEEGFECRSRGARNGALPHREALGNGVLQGQAVRTEAGEVHRRSARGDLRRPLAVPA
jgi:hypothetical protein